MRKQFFVPVALCLSYAFLFFGPFAGSDEPGSPTLLKAAASYYNAADAVQDLAVDIKQTRETQSNKNLVIEGKYFWKAPDKEWTDGKDANSVQALQVAAPHVMPMREIWNAVQALKKMKVVESKDGEETKIEATPKAGDKGAAETWWVDAQNRITHMQTTRTMRGGKQVKVEVVYECAEQEGKRLLTSMLEKMLGTGLMSKWEYASVNGVWLVAKESHMDLMYRSNTEYLNPQVNHGLPDSVFKDKAHPPEWKKTEKKDDAGKDEGKKDEGKKDEGKKEGDGK